MTQITVHNVSRQLFQKSHYEFGFIKVIPWAVLLKEGTDMHGSLELYLNI